MNEEKMDELLRLMRSVVPDTSDMSDAGRVGFVYRHNYDPAVQYEELDVVKFGMSLWTPKVATIGNPPPDQSQEGQENAEENDFWTLFLPGALGGDYVSKTDIAQPPTETEAGKLGVSKPDGKTITIDQDGTLHGASLDFVGTAAELKAAIAAGNVKAGMTAFIRQGDIDGDGMLVEVAEGAGMSMIGKVEDGEFVPYATMGDKQKGVPLFVFENKAAWQEEYDAGNVPDGSVVILLKDEEGEGSGTYVTVDGELSLESENPVQNKVITQEFEDVKGMRGSETGYGMVRLSAAPDVTDSTGLALPTREKNAALEGTLAHEISSLKDGFANINTKLFNKGYSPSGNDANNAVENGTVHCIGQIKNTPSAGYGVLAILSTGSYKFQLFASISGDGYFGWRSAAEGNHWGSWARIG